MNSRDFRRPVCRSRTRATGWCSTEAREPNPTRVDAEPVTEVRTALRRLAADALRQRAETDHSTSLCRAVDAIRRR
jgi:hypothetical protein